MQGSGQCAERTHQQGRDDHTAGDVAEVTEAHGNRGRDFVQNVERQHDRNGFQESLEVSAQALIPNVRVDNHAECHDCPAERGIQVCRNRAQADQRDERPQNRRE